MNSKVYSLGFLCGVLCVVLAGIIIRKVFKKKFGVNGNEYDERQKAIQGTGYKLAYMTMLGVTIIGGIVENMLGITWCSLFTFALIGMWISICVFITYCVIRDAYFSLRSRRKPLMIIMLAVGAINLLTGVCCVYLGVMMLVRTIYERRTEDME